MTHIANIVESSYSQIQARYRTDSPVGNPTGFADFDALTGGLHPSQLSVLAARPAMGKTTFSVNVALNVALNSQLPVLYLSLETSKERIVNRMLQILAEIDTDRLRNHNMVDSDWSRLESSKLLLASAPIFVNDYSCFESIKLEHEFYRFAQESGTRQLVLVDSIDFIIPDGREDSLRRLRALARELNLTILATADLDRRLEVREDKRPSLQDFPEADCVDNLFFLYRDEYYNPDTPDRGIAELLVSRQKNGPRGCVELKCALSTGKFSTLSES